MLNTNLYKRPSMLSTWLPFWNCNGWFVTSFLTTYSDHVIGVHKTFSNEFTHCYRRYCTFGNWIANKTPATQQQCLTQVCQTSNCFHFLHDLCAKIMRQSKCLSFRMCTSTMLVSLCLIVEHDVVYTAINRYFTFLLNVSALKSKFSQEYQLFIRSNSGGYL